jgi:hypothetical protein
MKYTTHRRETYKTPRAVVVLNHRGEITEQCGPYLYAGEVENVKSFLLKKHEVAGHPVCVIPYDKAKIGGSANF